MHKNHSKYQNSALRLVLFGLIFSQPILWGKLTFKDDVSLNRICNLVNFWAIDNLASLMCTLVRRQSGNFAKSWGRHPSIMKKKCIKKVLFLSGSTIKAITLSDKYQLHEAAQIFFTLNTFIFKRKWSKLVILHISLSNHSNHKGLYLKMCPLQVKFLQNQCEWYKKRVNSQKLIRGYFFYVSYFSLLKVKRISFSFHVNIMLIFV